MQCPVVPIQSPDPTSAQKTSAIAAVLDPLDHPPQIPMTPARRRTLWDIDADMAALDDLVEENEGDITACESIVDAWFAENQGNLVAKVDGYAAFIGELNARAEARKEESDRLAHRARIDAALRDFLKGRLKDFFTARGMKKLETKRYKLTVAGNGGKLPLLLDDTAKNEPEKLPEPFRRVTYSPNVEAIRAELEAGKPLRFACLGERGTHLRIT